MPKNSDIEYIVDARSRKKRVTMSFRTYQRLLEDIADLRCMEERKDETPRNLESILAEMEDAGRV